MTNPVIQLQHVSRIYRVGDINVHALRDVSLTIEAGEFVAIIGASGSGKSTLMAVLGCLDRPTSGSYVFEGLDVSQLNEPERARLRSERLGFVFQSFNLLTRTSALENVSLPLFYSATGPASAESRLMRAGRALQVLGLGDRERNTPGQLSGGQQQRVAIARALINEPAILLADEPTGNLDTHTSHDIMQTLSRLNREQGVTVIVVTHEQDIAAYADRTLTMRDGQIISDVCKPRQSKAVAKLVHAPDMSAAPSARTSRTHTAWAFGLMIVTAALQAIHRNIMRSALTMLGVFIGVAALIAMVALGQGANEAVRKQIEGLGSNLIVVMPGSRATGGARAALGSASTLTIDDAMAIEREANAVAKVSYQIRQSGQVQYGNQNWTTSIQGVTPALPPMTNTRVESGREITDDDVASTALVALVGTTVVRQLFGEGANPVGAQIQVKGVPIYVIGVLASKGQSPFGFDQDDVIMIPFTTAERKVVGVASPTQTQPPINWIYLSPPNPYALTPRTHRLRESNLCASRKLRQRVGCDAPNNRDLGAPPSDKVDRRC